MKEAIAATASSSADGESVGELPRLADAFAYAWFLDFDGTLVDIAPRPDAVRLSQRTRALVQCLIAGTGGAVAILTGRTVDCIDRYFEPLRLPVAGVHGNERRDAVGRFREALPAEHFCETVRRVLCPLINAEPGLLLERKHGAVALHYRNRPELETDCLHAMETVVAALPGYRVGRGKMVVEALPDHSDKGQALLAFLAEPPFKGRLPVMVGDDVTDEDAFQRVNDLGGVTIRVGEGATIARYRAASAHAFITWLEQLVASPPSDGSA